VFVLSRYALPTVGRWPGYGGSEEGDRRRMADVGCVGLACWSRRGITRRCRATRAGSGGRSRRGRSGEGGNERRED